MKQTKLNKAIVSFCGSMDSVDLSVDTIRTELLKHFKVDKFVYADHAEPIGELLMEPLAVHYGLTVKDGKFVAPEGKKTDTARKRKSYLLDLVCPRPGVGNTKAAKFETQEKANAFYVNSSTRVKPDHRIGVLRALAESFGIDVEIQ